jgi:hypothetical protein
MASRAGESRVKRRLRSGAPIPRNRAPGRDNRARSGRGTEGSNPSPSASEQIFIYSKQQLRLRLLVSTHKSTRTSFVDAGGSL